MINFVSIATIIGKESFTLKKKPQTTERQLYILSENMLKLSGSFSCVRTNLKLSNQRTLHISFCPIECSVV